VDAETTETKFAETIFIFEEPKLLSIQIYHGKSFDEAPKLLSIQIYHGKSFEGPKLLSIQISHEPIFVDI
jgi:hypothetical protein